MSTRNPPPNHPQSIFLRARVPSALAGRSMRCATPASAARTAPKWARPSCTEVIDRSRAVLGVPDDYRIAIVAASDTGAVEMALWNLIGARGVDVLAWEAFSTDWVTDVLKTAEDQGCAQLHSRLRQAARPETGQFR